MERFSKGKLRNYIERQWAIAETDFRAAAGKPFDRTDGTAQIPSGNVNAAVVYGRMEALNELAENLEP